MRKLFQHKCRNQERCKENPGNAEAVSRKLKYCGQMKWRKLWYCGQRRSLQKLELMKSLEAMKQGLKSKDWGDSMKAKCWGLNSSQMFLFLFKTSSSPFNFLKHSRPPHVCGYVKISGYCLAELVQEKEQCFMLSVALI